jgi:hypothetical protein
VTSLGRADNYRLHRASCAEAAQDKQPRQGNQREMAERQAPTIRATGPIEHQGVDIGLVRKNYSVSWPWLQVMAEGMGFEPSLVSCGLTQFGSAVASARCLPMSACVTSKPRVLAQARETE